VLSSSSTSWFEVRMTIVTIVTLASKVPTTTVVPLLASVQSCRIYNLCKIVLLVYRSRLLYQYPSISSVSVIRTLNVRVLCAGVDSFWHVTWTLRVCLSHVCLLTPTPDQHATLAHSPTRHFTRVHSRSGSIIESPS